MYSKQNKQVEKARKIFKGLTRRQQNKLYKDYDLLIDNTLNIKLNKVNSILESGYYYYNTWQYKTLKKRQTRLINKINITSFILENGYKYKNL